MPKFITACTRFLGVYALRFTSLGELFLWNSLDSLPLSPLVNRHIILLKHHLHQLGEFTQPWRGVTFSL